MHICDLFSGSRMLLMVHYGYNLLGDMSLHSSKLCVSPENLVNLHAVTG